MKILYHVLLIVNHLFIEYNIVVLTFIF